ncbi:MAG: hypothetical protein Q9170_002781 [Blastenia crenularia]
MAQAIKSSTFRKAAQKVRAKIYSDSGTRNQARRVDIVSPHLCDDALKRLSPSLRAYEGCTIIDVNPGLGLWSSKVHEIVKPRKHFLAEPPASPYLSHLEPLANQQESRYHLLDWSNEDLWKPDRYVAEGLMPAMDSLDSKKTNQPILLLYNTTVPLANMSPRSKDKSGDIKLDDWGKEVMFNSGFHTGGPVRMLMWGTDKLMSHVLPRTTALRTKLSLKLEMTSYVEQVVSADEPLPATNTKLRPWAIDLMSGQQVVRRMQDAGIVVPETRQTALYQKARERLLQSQGSDGGSQSAEIGAQLRGWHQELNNLMQRFENGEFAQAEGTNAGEPRQRFPRGTKPKPTPEFARLVQLERNLTHNHNRAKATEELLQEQAEIDSLDVQAFQSRLENPQQAALEAELQERKEKLRERVKNSAGKHIRMEFERFRHDRKAYNQDPPLLMWDQRKAEPLKAYKQEFSTDNCLGLLDIEPRKPLRYPMTMNQEKLFSVLMNNLFVRGTDNLSALNHVAPGAYEAITPKVPALTDPTRGGERDLRDLQITRLTPEMAYGLVMAWLEWPFKPTLTELLHQHQALHSVDFPGGDGVA